MTNLPTEPAEQIVFLANDRCNQPVLFMTLRPQPDIGMLLG